MSIEIQNFPRDVLGEIFSRLDGKSICRAEQVCKNWNRSTEFAWKARCLMNWPLIPNPDLKNRSWKAHYQICTAAYTIFDFKAMIEYWGKGFR